MPESRSSEALPLIPSKRYFTIGEVGTLCGVKPHVLRYWEKEFPQLKPVKRQGNRRYYRHQDMAVVRRIRSLLRDEGYTVAGARQRLSKETSRTREVQVDAQEMTAVIKDLEQVIARL